MLHAIPVVPAMPIQVLDLYKEISDLPAGTRWPPQNWGISPKLGGAYAPARGGATGPGAQVLDFIE
jgi:hypothetical protein